MPFLTDYTLSELDLGKYDVSAVSSCPLYTKHADTKTGTSFSHGPVPISLWDRMPVRSSKRAATASMRYSCSRPTRVEQTTKLQLKVSLKNVKMMQTATLKHREHPSLIYGMVKYSRNKPAIKNLT